MNRGLNRENPDILIVMIAEKQIVKGCDEEEEDKGDQPFRDDERDREGGMGPLKPATEMSGTAPSKSLVEQAAYSEIVSWWVIISYAKWFQGTIVSLVRSISNHVLDVNNRPPSPWLGK